MSSEYAQAKINNLQESVVKVALYINTRSKYLNLRDNHLANLNAKKLNFNNQIVKTNQILEQELKSKTTISITKQLQRQQKDGDNYTAGIDSMRVE